MSLSLLELNQPAIPLIPADPNPICDGDTDAIRQSFKVDAWSDKLDFVAEYLGVERQPFAFSLLDLTDDVDQFFVVLL